LGGGSFSSRLKNSCVACGAAAYCVALRFFACKRVAFGCGVRGGRRQPALISKRTRALIAA